MLRAATLTLARFNTYLIMNAVYMLVLIPIGLVYRLFRWDPLTRRSFGGKNAPVWSTCKPFTGESDSLRRQS